MWEKAKAGPLASSNSKIYLILFAPQYTVKNNLLPQVYLFKWKKNKLYYLFWEKKFNLNIFYFELITINFIWCTIQ